MLPTMSWMAWTLPTALFFVGIVVTLTAMTIWQAVRPALPRRGLLPLSTTPGDRLFIGLLTAAFIHLIWLGLTDVAPWPALIISLGVLAAILRWA